MPKLAKDRFDVLPRSSGRVGAHRAEAPRMNAWVVLLWSAVAALVLIVAGIFGTLVLMDRISLFAGEETPAPTQDAGVIDTSYSVLVLNASGAAGRGEQMVETVVGAGWDRTNVNTSDVDVFDATTVYYAADADKEAAQGLANAIGGAFVEQSDVYSDAANPDLKQLVIVIGTDRATDDEADQ